MTKKQLLAAFKALLAHAMELECEMANEYHDTTIEQMDEQKQWSDEVYQARAAIGAEEGRFDDSNSQGS